MLMRYREQPVLIPIPGSRATAFWNSAITAASGLHGITDRMDIGVAYRYTMLPDDERGFEGAKIGMTFGLVPDLISVSAAGCLGDQAFDINGILSKDIGPLLLDVNIGMTATAQTDQT
jgi:hypothetical protein